MSSMVMSEDNRAAKKFKASQKKVTNAQVGMMVLIASFTMLFGTLLLSYLLIRERMGAWPPIGVEPLDKQVTTLSTMLLLASSIFIHFSIKDFKAKAWEQFAKRWSIGTWAGLGFLLLQSLFVVQLWQQGHRVSDGLFASVTYVLVVFHALHVIGAWGWMLWVQLKAMAGSYSESKSQAPVLAAWFWHFLDIVWVLTYVLLVWY